MHYLWNMKYDNNCISSKKVVFINKVKSQHLIIATLNFTVNQMVFAKLSKAYENKTLIYFDKTFQKHNYKLIFSYLSIKIALSSIFFKISTMSY